MTADQVEFSTGWTCTARIASRDDAIKFLHNYPNGTLEKVMDHEIRAFLQAAFGLEVTDLPMDELRKKATPHIKNVTERTEKFFSDRGVQITNIGTVDSERVAIGCLIMLMPLPIYAFSSAEATNNHPLKPKDP